MLCGSVSQQTSGPGLSNGYSEESGGGTPQTCTICMKCLFFWIGIAAVALILLRK